jgi:hypothetical protein
LKIIFLFPPEFGRPKASTFRSWGVPGRLDALLAKSLVRTFHEPGLPYESRLGGVTIFRLLGLAFGFELVRERIRVRIKI